MDQILTKFKTRNDEFDLRNQLVFHGF